MSRYYCACGASLFIGVKTPPDIRKGFLSDWEKMHSGPGCAPATPRECYKARAKSELKTIKERGK